MHSFGSIYTEKYYDRVVTRMDTPKSGIRWETGTE